ncbi:tripartite tricarboxylate transporter substrate binding protein [Pseudalkalibacillus berkeleyi]|uniref:Tripartite tricarboxylate transporter substrate binding protein n=1 Tax=Pseudalkalibacillus berkeleyi TaxID=1069813 RepID=A0ABS9H3V9_9BACL|nr:tripartite tricarboxylate transporter substrate binding protein [Pseudalkalibacillus berkeleyi]MCF6138558.1 tripartite tricarboxylate transporter substrate binding protein [Pseudalkalibacillus berkeleyi]
MKNIWMIAILSLLVFATACGNEGANSENTDDGEWKPNKNIEIVAPSGAGGGWDTTARSVAKVMEDEGVVEKDMGVVNKPGGGGAVGWSYINSTNNPHNIFVSSPPLVFVPLNGQSDLSYEDFTPLSNMIADYGAFAVAEDAKWDNLNELFDDMKKDPSSVTVVGTSSPGSMDHMQFVKLAKEAGVDIKKIKYVSSQDGGALTQILNGSADVFSTGVAETVEQVRAGKIKVLGITSEERLEGEVLSKYKTAKEQGIDATFVNWRGFFGPKDMDPAAVKYYEEKFKAVSDSEAFADIRKKYGWDEMYMNSEEYQTFLKKQTEELGSLLDELGLGKK